jgi:hypothetical protein
MRWAKKNHPPEIMEIILEDGKLLVIEARDYEIIAKAMSMAVEADRFGQRKRWFQPQENQTEYTQGFYAGRMYEQKRIMNMIKEGNNEG